MALKTPIHMLKDDHRKVKQLFEDFENTEDQQERYGIARKAIKELAVHAELEEEIFYPTVRAKIDDAEIMDEAAEEHHVAKVLMNELQEMDARDERFSAKFMVLAENVRHHIKEEEGEMLPEAQKADIDFEALAERMMQRKLQLMEQVGLEPDMAMQGPKRTRSRKAA